MAASQPGSLGDREKYRQKRRTPRRPSDVGGLQISKKIEEVSELVPEIGDGYRWYDRPYRALHWVADGPLRMVLPRSVRSQLYRWINLLYLYNEHDRDKAWSLDDWQHNVFVPQDEHVYMGGIWVVELFPPTELPKLQEAIAKNGWDRHRRSIPWDDNTRERLEKSRSAPLHSWWRFADVVSTKSGWFVPDAIRQDLPPEVELVEIRAIQVGSGLTAALARFNLSEGASTSLDKEWHRQHEPMLIRQKGHLRNLDRQFSTFWQVQSERRRLHSVARRWLAHQLPGFFVQNKHPQPLLDLLLMDHLDPTEALREDMAREDSISLRNALRSLGLELPVFELLESPDLPKLVLTSLDHYSYDALGNDPTWTLWGKRDAVVEALGKDALLGCGDDKNHMVARRLVRNMHNLFVMIATSEFLRITEASYSKLRDQASTRHGKFKPAALRELRKGFLTLSLNLASVHQDVEGFWRRPWGWEGDAVFSWRKVDDRKANAEAAEKESEKDKVTFNDRLRERHQKWFARMVEADHNYRDILSTVASLGASVDAFKMGRWALWVALGSLVVAVVALLITDLGGNNLLAAIAKWIQALIGQ